MKSPVAAAQRASNQSLVADAVASTRKIFIGVAVFSAVINILMLTGPMFMLQVYDRVMSSRSIPTLVALVILIAVLFAFMGALDFVRARILTRIGLLLDEKLRGPVFDAVLSLQLARQGQGDGQQPIRDLDILRGFMSGAAPITLFDLPWMPFYMAVVFLLHPILGMVATAGAVIVVVMTVITDIMTKAPTKRATEEAGRRNAWTEDSRRNAESVRALGMSVAIRDHWLASHARMLGAQLQSSDVGSGLQSVTKSLRMFQQSLMLGVGAYLVIEQMATPGVMIASSIISARALAPVEQAIGQWRGFIQFRQAYDRLKRLLIAAPPARMSLPAPTAHLAVGDVATAPPGSRAITLSGINFALKAGQAMAVIGPSAAGKSTLARLLIGVWPLARGEIRLDGATIDQWTPDELGKSLGYLPQTVELFDGTVAENIARFAPDRSDASILQAARISGAHEIIIRLADGYDTRIGEGGTVLSAGQKQRIGLARALYGEPFLLVLDEPNANLDREGELALVNAIRAIRERGGIVVVMAHRPSALAEVDHVLVLSEGRQVAFGPRDEILRKTLTNPDVVTRATGISAVQKAAANG